MPTNTEKSISTPYEPKALLSPKPTFIKSMKYVSGEINSSGFLDIGI